MVTLAAIVTAIAVLAQLVLGSALDAELQFFEHVVA